MCVVCTQTVSRVVLVVVCVCVCGMYSDCFQSSVGGGVCVWYVLRLFPENEAF